MTGVEAMLNYVFCLFRRPVLSFTLYVLAGLAAFPVSATADSRAPESYKLGIFPYMAPRQTVEFFGPVAASMEQALGHPVKLQSVPTFRDFSEAMSLHDYDIALIQPFNYAEAVEKYGYLPLARLSVPLISKLYVRSDSHYQKLEELRGTTIAMPPAESANARMMLRALYENKLIPGRDVQVHYFSSHDSCIQQVWVGKASACATAPPVVSVFEQRMHARLRPVFDTPPIPHMLFVVHPRVPVNQRKKLAALVTGWNQNEAGRVILKSLGLPGFVPVKAGEYDLLHDYDAGVMSGDASVASDELMLGVFPYFTARLLSKNVSPILPALRRATAHGMQLRTSANFGSFMDGVASGNYDVVLVQPFSYAKSIQSGYLPLAAMKNSVQGLFLVREQSVYQSINDLKGKTVAMGPLDSALARLGYRSLMQAHLVPGRDVTVNYRPNHASCLREVQSGTAAACVSSQLNLRMWIPLAQNLRFIARTETLPGVLFLAHKRVPANIREKLQKEILSWKDTAEGRTILQSLGFGEAIPVDMPAYQKLQSFEEIK